jgi:hypothetical protein
MTETIEKRNEIEETKEIKVEKPYTFRRLCAEDIFPMFTIINKIGIKEFKSVMGESGEFMKLVSSAIKKDAKAENAENDIIESGLSVAMDVVGIITGNLPKCENEIFKLLAQTSNLNEKAIRKMDFASFIEMIVDFVKKEEFKDFIKAVSKLFK